MPPGPGDDRLELSAADLFALLVGRPLLHPPDDTAVDDFAGSVAG